MAKPLIETADDVMSALTEIRSHPAASMADAYNAVEYVRSFVSGNVGIPPGYDYVFRIVGSYVDNILFSANAHEFNTPKFAELLLSKHERYGPDPIRRWGPLGVVIRIDSKFARWETMTKSEKVDDLGEPINDTLTDILGYCVLGLRLMKEYA